jgi:hypothetical protein
LFLGIAAWFGTPAPNVYACSGSFNPDVIIAGTVAGWRPVEHPGGDVDPFLGTRPYQAVAVTVDVEQVLKGATSSKRIEFLDLNSLRKAPWNTRGDLWGPSGPTCAAFGVDPTDQYLIMGLKRADDGSLRLGGSLGTFFFGQRDQLSGETYNRVRAELAYYGLVITPPGTGGGGLR